MTRRLSLLFTWLWLVELGWFGLSSNVLGPNTTRDQRRDIKLMYRLGYTQNAIGLGLQLSEDQVRYAISHDETPTKRSGRPSKLNQDQLEELEAFVTASKANRRMPYSKIPAALGWNVGEYCIRHALRKLGYNRCVAKLRLDWALEHRDWTLAQWATILWSDETWVSPGIHKRIWVIRKPGEELNPTCIVERLRKKGGWMFWGCFSGLADKGPSLFWEKEWGSIKQISYCERIWPPYSPDLNPIENVWNWMKDWIQENYPQETMGYDRLRVAVQEAWNAVPVEFLYNLLAIMPARCEAVIAANGLHTKY
ncbi:uncharacterized protein TRIVIDRAFT_193599 [Trichoderma virens Gv29-8]|uniref:Tc1-like transposase DDE domain-containing protein n=1 Tax=Hypocrea virens (strain Gv29-8 / FGSC 10586) TaxID=413071 RepID=G9N1Z2_HYPVG|nr:uncharacterized protein TRIVIDRAFT_193599 [Trichoderma virens Gv29-8]EHK19109.1 hypothetical protein TRIVIDRAFT_193599 [Trichoderma virens Gv29-8]